MQYGGPEVLIFEEAPQPVSGSGEVLIRVHAAGVNPIDWKIRAGYLKDVHPYTFPLILGWTSRGWSKRRVPAPEGLEKVMRFTLGLTPLVTGPMPNTLR